MSTLNTASIVQEKNELDAICADLGLKDIKYLTSPKDQNGNISDLTKHATLMLKTYKQHIDGHKDVAIKEIFTEE
jgi:hypothetical protein